MDRYSLLCKKDFPVHSTPFCEAPRSQSGASPARSGGQNVSQWNTILIVPLDFRHPCINNWRKDGHDYFKIMAFSGHKTISVFKRYNMVDEKELRTLIFPIGTSVGTMTTMENEKEVSSND